MGPNIEFTVICGKCHSTLDRNVDVDDKNKDGVSITIEPCMDCMNERYKEGYDTGYEEGGME